MKLLKTNDGLNTYYSSEYNQTYHSIHGVLQEAEYVFLISSAVLQKMQSQSAIRILEIGFGTGFNFFITAEKALKYKACIEYSSIENSLLTYEKFLRLNHNHFELANNVRDEFLLWRAGSTNPPAKNKFRFNKNIELKLMLADAQTTKFPADYFDAVYHDAFSPQENPELWTPAFFKKVYCAMKYSAKLSTYSAKGTVRRAMLQAGFKVEKHKGPKGKREILVAIKN